MTEENKPARLFIRLSIIFSLLFIVGLIIIFTSYFPICSDLTSKVWWQNQTCVNFGYFLLYPLLILMPIFAFYSIIMSIFIFSKKLKNVYSFAILSIITNVLAILSYYVGAVFLKNGFQILAIVSYFALFFVSLYILWRK